jgi:hypothetical protein
VNIRQLKLSRIFNDFAMLTQFSLTYSFPSFLQGSRPMKRWTDQMAMASGGFSLSIVCQFDGNQLLPILLRTRK